ncbi:hypothetical protein [Frigidibacter oleivorans]|uniref:hypothetical protein n=1 Tax=Frigidibacter oleivorans TaxID=2487129 RepID=UPI000F8CF9E2|nr:hypothetical protein [Frigidibacter oleivorans]
MAVAPETMQQRRLRETVEILAGERGDRSKRAVRHSELQAAVAATPPPIDTDGVTEIVEGVVESVAGPMQQQIEQALADAAAAGAAASAVRDDLEAEASELRGDIAAVSAEAAQINTDLTARADELREDVDRISGDAAQISASLSASVDNLQGQIDGLQIAYDDTAQAVLAAQGYATDASTSAGAAAQMADAASGFANAASGHADFAAAKADEAGQHALAASEQVTLAETAAGAATTALGQVAEAVETAEGHAATAGISADAAANSANAAGDAADASAGSASIASTKADDAAREALAAQTAATEATTAANNAANTVIEQVSQAITDAEGHSAAAGISAQAAANSAQDAQDASGAASGFADAASGFANTASTRADDAGQYALAAEQHMIDAQTALGGATSLFDQVAEAVETAEGFATTAGSTQSVVARMSLQAGEAARGNFAPRSTFEDGLRDGYSTTSQVTDVPAPHPLGRTKALRLGVRDTQGYRIGTTGANEMWHENLVGRTFRVRGWVYNAAASDARIGIRYTRLSTGTSSFTPIATAPAAGGAWVEVEAERTFTEDCTDWNLWLQMNGTTGPATEYAWWTDLEWQDITSETAAEDAVEAAAGFANTASVKADDAAREAAAAGEWATAAETAASNAANSVIEQVSQAVTDAEGHSAAAGISADAAARSADDAASASGAASDFADAASGFANTASTKADDAAREALAAAQAVTDAETAASNANTALEQVSQAVDDAGNFAAMAGISATAAASITSRAISAITDPFLDREEPGYWQRLGGQAQLTKTDNKVFSTGKTWSFITPAGADEGVSTESTDTQWTGMAGASAYLVEIEFTLVSGSLAGAGVRVDWINDASEAFSAEKPLSEMMLGTLRLGDNMTASGIFAMPEAFAGAFASNALFAFVNHAAFTKAAKTLELHRIAIRPATAEETAGGIVEAAIDARVSEEAAARVDGDEALATRVEMVEADYGDLSASVTQTANAIATIEGNMAATLSFRVQAGSEGALLELVASDGPDGPVSVARIDATEILLNGTVTGQHIQAYSMDASIIGSGKLTSDYIEVTTLLEMSATTAAFSMTKVGPDDPADGVYMGRYDVDGAAHFSFAASRTVPVKNTVQALTITPGDGLVLQNARHILRGGLPAPYQTVDTTQEVMLTPGAYVLKIRATGGGGGGAGVGAEFTATAQGSSSSRVATPGGDGEPTMVQVYDGNTLIKTLISQGGDGAGTSYDSAASNRQAGEASYYGAFGRGAGGASTVVQDSGYTTSDNDKLITVTTAGTGGGAATTTSSGDIDIEGMVAPKLVVTIGAGGAAGAAPSSFDARASGASGRPGRVEYSLAEKTDIPADVVPLMPTASGQIFKNGVEITFPDLGAGLWVLFTGDGNSMGTGRIYIAEGAWIDFSYERIVSFFSAGTPVYHSNGSNSIRTIQYLFYSMGSWGGG